MKKHVLSLIFFLNALCTSAGVKSPDGRLETFVEQEGGRTYLVLKDSAGLELVRTRTGFTTAGEDFSAGLRLLSLTEGETLIESYTALHGKCRQIRHPYTRCEASLESRSGSPLRIEMRLFNDGLAFRYLLDNKSGARLEFTGEETAYTLPSASRRWLQQYVTSYEGDFPLQEDGAVRQGAWGYPALFQLPGERFALITEAGLTRSYCATHLDSAWRA